MHENCWTRPFVFNVKATESNRLRLCQGFQRANAFISGKLYYIVIMMQLIPDVEMTLCSILINTCEICIFVTLASLKAKFSKFNSLFLFLFIRRKVPSELDLLEQFPFFEFKSFRFNRCILQVNLDFFQYFYKTP